MTWKKFILNVFAFLCCLPIALYFWCEEKLLGKENL